MKKFLVTTIFCGSLAMPALAQDATTTCAEFTQMDAAAQMSALASIQAEGVPGADTGATTELDGSADTDVTAGVEGSTELDTDATASVEGSAGEPSDGSAGMDAEITASAVADACADNPGMLVVDAIEEAKFN